MACFGLRAEARASRFQMLEGARTVQNTKLLSPDSTQIRHQKPRLTLPREPKHEPKMRKLRMASPNIYLLRAEIPLIGNIVFHVYK